MVPTEEMQFYTEVIFNGHEELLWSQTLKVVSTRGHALHTACLALDSWWSFQDHPL